jgi:hypothetical protein
LRAIAAEAFVCCRSLQSIIFPSSVEFIGALCFADCRHLASVIFPHDSRLVRIEDGAFAFCPSLESFFVPSQVEFVGRSCFCRSTKIADLVFGSPSHVRELLALPARLSGFQHLPDSVEILSVSGDQTCRGPCTLEFGRESRLQRILKDEGDWHGPMPVFRDPYGSRKEIPLFLRVSSQSLKVFRRNLEFECLSSAIRVRRTGISYLVSDRFRQQFRISV